MPRGDHFRVVTEDQILSVFDRGDLHDRFGRKLLKAKEVAQVLNEEVLEDETITGEAVRQRMHKIDDLETEEFGNAVLWKRKGAEVFAGGLRKSHMPSVHGLPDTWTAPAALAGSVFMVIVAVLFGLVSGHAPPPGQLVVAAAIGAPMFKIVVWLASAFIYIHQRFRNAI